MSLNTVLWSGKELITAQKHLKACCISGRSAGRKDWVGLKRFSWQKCLWLQPQYTWHWCQTCPAAPGVCHSGALGSPPADGPRCLVPLPLLPEQPRPDHLHKKAGHYYTVITNMTKNHLRFWTLKEKKGQKLKPELFQVQKYPATPRPGNCLPSL